MGEDVVGLMVVVQPQADLLEVVDALRASRRFASGLHRWQQKRDQDSDDGDDHQEFDQSEASSRSPIHADLP